jgi:SAM-dependent methyltransferase
MAAVYDRFMRPSEEACLAAWRAELLAGLKGDVLEVGAGTGLNLPHYPPEVRRLVVTEPERAMRSKLERKVAAAGSNVVVSDDAADALSFPDATFDAVVSTLVLCSVDDPRRALLEIRRVLRPDGRLLFIEHVAATDNPRRLRLQRLVEPLWLRVAGNCHCTRSTEQSIVDAGFRMERVERQSMRKAMPHVRPTVRGVARVLTLES